MAEQYGRLDQWSKTAAIDVAKARELAAMLEQRGRGADEVAARDAYLTLLGIGPGQRVLEVGCGSGVVLRDLASRVGPNGLALGLDPSVALLAIARELADEAGLGQSIELREGDARALPFGAAEFDAALAVTALAHIPDGRRAIPELVRVVRPGGRVGILDRDADSYIVTHPDRELTRRIVAARSDYGSADGWLARSLPRLMATAGLRDVQVRAFTSIETDPGGFYSRLAERSADTAISAGVISEEERRQWLEALATERASGGFIAGMTLLFAWGTRADGPTT
jgi:ubiquinone/menaquinone biosynthesis C-methylase UbiE